MSQIKTLTADAHSPSQPVTTAAALKQLLPVDPVQIQKISQHRQEIKNIVKGTDPRFLVIVGPCSIHDPVAVHEYGERLQHLAQTYNNDLKIVMRAYLEKPRSSIGWKGYVYDPSLQHASSSQQNLLAEGLHSSRQLLLALTSLDLALATEVLNPMLASYFDDLYSWGAIGARTSESQIHREIASSLPYAIGFKNGTDGNVDIALDACVSASQAQQFFGLNALSQPAMLESRGNDSLQLILRGSQRSTNYDAAAIAAVRQRCQQKNLDPAIIVDCSHGNSQKDPERQVVVLQTIMQQLEQTQVRGVMLESHLYAGKQDIHARPLRYGCSITDGCLGWSDTQHLLEQLAGVHAKRQKQRALAVSA
jgi:3-deoxy-7-phosphoheptulonate synthase